MSIGKPKNDPIDLNGLMNEIENDHRITVESDAIDKHIEELRAAQKDLRQATETLEKATMTLNGAIAALKSATDNSTNIVTGINNAIVKAQENTEYKVSIAQEDMELLMKNSQAVLGKHPIKYPFSLLYFHCTFAFAILHELLTYFHYDTRTI